MCVGQCQLLSKSVHGDLLIGPVVKGSKVRKDQICFIKGSNFKQPFNNKMDHVSVLVSVNHRKVFMVASSSDLWLRG